MRHTIMLIAALGVAQEASAWEGVNDTTGSEVTIEKGNLVREGREIEVLDHGIGRYRTLEVESMRSRGEKVIIETVDPRTGKQYELEMRRR